jgi:hypothetical protein
MSSDLEAIFRLMWANRKRLRATMPEEEADAVVFHLLVPAKRTMAILEPMLIDESIGKLIIKGHMDEGSCYAWFNFTHLPQSVELHDVFQMDSQFLSKHAISRMQKRGMNADSIATLARSIKKEGFEKTGGIPPEVKYIGDILRKEPRVLGYPCRCGSKYKDYLMSLLSLQEPKPPPAPTISTSSVYPRPI